MSNPFEAPWTSVAPSSWQRTYLGHLVDVRSGATPSKDEPSFWNGEIPWVSPKDMKVLRIADSEDHVSDAALSGSALRWVAKGSVLMVTRGMILNHTVPVALVERPLTINQDMKALVPRGALRGDFLMWLLVGLNPAILARVEEAAHGTKALRTEQWRKLPLAMPPVDIQRRIADFLDRKTAAIDTLIAKQEQLLALLSEKRQALITDRVTPDDTACPHWKRTRLAWVIREVRRPVDIQPATQYAEIGVRSHGRGTFHKEPVFGWELGEKKVYWVEPGDLVFNIVFAWERAVAVVQEADRGRIASHRFPTYRAVNEAADVRFLRYLFMSDYGRFLLDQNSPGAAGRNRTLDRSSLLKEEVLLPPVEEQRRIAIALDNALRVLDRTSEAVEQQLARLREYRQALITAAVTGQLDVTTIEAEQATNVVEAATA